ncbi:polysaccharide pyruvyl transferase family protein [Halomonas halodenitrificans]|uniref:polysaccharide pyruvyl transferase family protein n=1 Tax=Halomonas halodenitrificans TaxID=28252 RepID=UPI000A020813|nr:polysaccharide pyruvyl transferase family protein [Halomonas halodenitrificans]
MSKLNIFYWNKRDNFGDVLAKYVMSYYGAWDVHNVYGSKSEGDYISPIGSVLHIAPRNGLHVFGSGFMSPDKIGSKVAPKEVITLRGQLSADIADKLGWQPPQALGDTGLLASRIFPKERACYKLGVILHYAHAVEETPDLPGVIFINPQDPVNEVIKKISSCEKILSSSLHGLIVAHSYKIPWVRLNVIDHQLGGGDFKFNDFYTSIGHDASCEIECSVNELRSGLVELLHKVDRVGCSDFKNIDALQIRIESAFYSSGYFKNILKPTL